MTAARGFPAFPPRPGRRGRSWWAREFVAAMEDATRDSLLLRRARRFAGSGRVGPLTLSPGRIGATVDDPDGAYDVVVRLTAWDGPDQARFLDQVAAEAGHLAALLDGDVPRSLLHAAAASGVALLPTIGDLESDCDCPDIGDPCDHAAALAYQAAWLLDDDPFLLLLLRGLDRDTLLDALGQRRAGAAAATVDPDPLERPVAASLTYATTPAPLPDLGLSRPRRAVVPAVPPAPGLPEDLLADLVRVAADRARTITGGAADR
ncbi:SWIM zinc finger family protein [Pseudonocardia sp. GCM10023141]|uniref:SWIM zinc finger family protein n=1 Tax=Pseudonocardia sp. GCM10023141 TaxID=3252653 RepID=UPI00360E5ED8